MIAQSRVTSRCDVAHYGRENLPHFFPFSCEACSLYLILYLCNYVVMHGHSSTGICLLQIQCIPSSAHGGIECNLYPSCCRTVSELLLKQIVLSNSENVYRLKGPLTQVRIVMYVYMYIHPTNLYIYV